MGVPPHGGYPRACGRCQHVAVLNREAHVNEARYRPARLGTTEFATQEGTLYPLLSKMRRDGLVEYVWQESDAGPPRKYYKLTTKGNSQLAELNEYWKSINATVSQLGR